MGVIAAQMLLGEEFAPQTLLGLVVEHQTLGVSFRKLSDDTDFHGGKLSDDTFFHGGKLSYDTCSHLNFNTGTGPIARAIDGGWRAVGLCAPQARPRSECEQSHSDRGRALGPNH